MPSHLTNPNRNCKIEIDKIQVIARGSMYYIDYLFDMEANYMIGGILLGVVAVLCGGAFALSFFLSLASSLSKAPSATARIENPFDSLFSQAAASFSISYGISGMTIISAPPAMPE